MIERSDNCEFIGYYFDHKDPGLGDHKDHKEIKKDKDITKSENIFFSAKQNSLSFYTSLTIGKTIANLISNRFAFFQILKEIYLSLTCLQDSENISLHATFIFRDFFYTKFKQHDNDF